MLELLVVFTVFFLAAAISVPPILNMSRELRVRGVATEIVVFMQRARLHAIRHNVKVAVKFDTDHASIGYGLYRDGDADGVRNRDIDDGTDPQVFRTVHTDRHGRLVRFGFPPDLEPTDPGDPRSKLERLDDPIRFGSSDLASFDPRGTSSPGTVYLTDGESHLFAVRVDYRVGKMRILKYDAKQRIWLRD
ncbi:MAG: GspH/FimT family pseudopilin [Acidobacteriota bacterium]